VATYNGICYVGAGLVGTVAGAILDRFHDRAVTTAAGLVYPREAYTVLFACLVLIAVACGSEMIPGNWGKVESGWLVQPL
jgi:hypothetical protein